MTEAQGRALLKGLFTAAGYAIAEDFHFDEGGVVVDLDGWDAGARVGYEYITREAGDHLQFDERTLGEFEARMERGELHVLLVDETEAITEAALEGAGRGFLAELGARKAGGAA